jgi:AraC-like DNA-binding protein
MSYCIASPSEKLKPYIKQYWAVENMLNQGEQYTQRIIPGGLPELTLYIGNKPKVCVGRRSLEDNFLLNGQQNDYYDILISENLSIFSISFLPQGLSQFFSLPIHELLNINASLKYINKELYEELEGKLSASVSFQEKIDITERYFINLLANNNRRFEFLRIDNIIELIRRTKGNISIDKLASDSCLSRKQFERTFLEYIGISPKQYLKIIRLQAAIDHKSKNKQISLTNLAYENGYYDQSHFIHDFRTMTGLTPKQFFDHCEPPISDFFQ